MHRLAQEEYRFKMMMMLREAMNSHQTEMQTTLRRRTRMEGSCKQSPSSHLVLLVRADARGGA